MTKPDFSGYATKNDLRCSDGRIIRRNAFAGNDGAKVPLVWQHGHNDPTNVIGHAILENRDDGVYAYGYFNNTEMADTARELVAHGDIGAMSIYANRLRQNGSDVEHGNIVEVSLVLAGANPGALIENVAIRHDDGSLTEEESEAVVYSGEALSHEDPPEAPTQEEPKTVENIKHEDTENTGGEKTVGDVYETMNEEQKTVVAFLIQQALSGADDDSDDAEHSDTEGEYMAHSNIFEGDTEDDALAHIDRDELQAAVFADAKAVGSFRDSALAHAQEYGVENIELLFPDAKAVSDEPTFIKRQTEWVASFMNGTTHRPFARIKSLQADITADEARAKGYIKGNRKKEEVFKLLKRVTTPTTIYKKQKLDRDDIIDITDFDVVRWIDAEMRVMLDEEIARAALIGDGRTADDEDKINEENIRPIYTDDELYSIKHTVAADFKDTELVDEIIRAIEDYRGTGRPTLYASADVINALLLQRDQLGRRLYKNLSELASEMDVAGIVKVDLMKGLKREGNDLLGILVNPVDYIFGTDKGGEITSFQDFDIDYNQYKYLKEGRCSGALRDPFTAIVLERAGA